MQRMRNISHLILEAKQHKHKPHQFLAQPTNKKKHQQDSKQSFSQQKTDTRTCNVNKRRRIKQQYQQPNIDDTA